MIGQLVKQGFQKLLANYMQFIIELLFVVQVGGGLNREKWNVTWFVASLG